MHAKPIKILVQCSMHNEKINLYSLSLLDNLDSGYPWQIIGEDC